MCLVPKNYERNCLIVNSHNRLKILKRKIQYNNRNIKKYIYLKYVKRVQ